MIEIGKSYRIKGNSALPVFADGAVVVVVDVRTTFGGPMVAVSAYGDPVWVLETCLEEIHTSPSLKIRLSNGATKPFYATSGAAGFDITANETVTINPGHWVPVHTGLYMQLPEGEELQIRSRSGIAKRDGLVVHQGIGTIDSDYRGEVIVMLRNVGLNARTIERGTRIAQGVIAPVCRYEFDVVDALDDTDRGVGGFGSTGA